MKLTEMFSKKHKRIVVIVQCRLSSTRLPRKALLPLGGKCVLEWVLASMKKVKADKYFLAVDKESEGELSGIAKKCGWDFFAGSQTDVLDRFCKVIELSKADLVVRATADNPFLFYENANALVEAFLEREESDSVDYMTFSGLPHGSGVEMFNAHSLLKARDLTNDPYDHEHVGPALYNHPEHFVSAFVKSPKPWYHPELRTTIDTPSDYRRALSVVRFLSKDKPVTEPYTTEEILSAMNEASVLYPLLLIPSTQKGRGTGHLRRCLDLAIKTGADIYIPLDSSLEQCASLVAQARAGGLLDYQIVRNIDDVSGYNLVITDSFKTDSELLEKLTSQTAVCGMDEGNLDTSSLDYLLDIIPSVDLLRKANKTEPGFISLPRHRKTEKERPSALHTALVVLGGEDPLSLTLPAALALAKNEVYVTAVAEEDYTLIPDDLAKYIKFSGPIENLKEKLSSYDLVVTHYGFTAFEAAAAGCAVVLLATSPLHEKLSLTYGFNCLGPLSITEQKFASLLSKPELLYKKNEKASSENNEELSDFVTRLSMGKAMSCPVCGKSDSHTPFEVNTLLSRTEERTFRRCSQCGIIYQSWSMQPKPVSYNHDYFFADYQKQYGKTYLEDFASIKAQCVRRLSMIDLVYRRFHSSFSPSVLDVGCAMGPFLDAANDAGWQVFGTDVSPDAVSYVHNTLQYPAVCAPFPKTDLTAEFGIEKFDALTMWYVIEHFENLDLVLKEVSRLVKKGGVFAFSTPSGSGISRRSSPDDFFKNSPADHYSIWEPEKVAGILKRYGFRVVKIVSTGIHPERFPSAKKHGWKEKSLPMKILRVFSRVMKWGDTFEVYARKV